MQQKTCTKCGEVKELSCFNKSRKAPDGHRTECKFCQGVSGKIAREKHLPPPTKIKNLPPIEFEGIIYHEEWRTIKTSPKRHYMVSSFGRVKAMPSKYNRDERLLKPLKHGDGDLYLYVKLCSGNKETAINIHRLLALAFIPNPQKKPQVNHEDGKNTNNFIFNLSWVTAIMMLFLV